MAAIDQYGVASNADFQNRIRMLMLRAAAAVQAEDPEAVNHNQRSQLAKNIFHNPGDYAVRFAFAVAADPNNAGIGLESNDDALLFTVNLLYDAFALP